MTVFRSYSEEALGKKTLLLSSMRTIDKHSHCGVECAGDR